MILYIEFMETILIYVLRSTSHLLGTVLLVDYSEDYYHTRTFILVLFCINVMLEMTGFVELWWLILICITQGMSLAL